MTVTDTETIRLLLVEDHLVVRQGLRTLLEHTPGMQVVGEAGTAHEAVSAASSLNPNVVVLDVRLPDGNGFEVCRQIQDLPGDTRVLFLTSYADDNLVMEAVKSGADGYLLKDVDFDRLIDAIRRVNRGQSILDPGVTRALMNSAKNRSENLQANKLDLLSPQELRVLALVAEGKTNKEVGVAMGLSDKTVKNYLSNVLDKLEMSRRSEATAYFVRHSGE